jgi:hypothetical protein
MTRCSSFASTYLRIDESRVGEKIKVQRAQRIPCPLAAANRLLRFGCPVYASAAALAAI